MRNLLLTLSLLLGAASVYLELFSGASYGPSAAGIIDLIILLVCVLEFSYSLARAGYKRIYLSHNIVSTAILLLYAALLVAHRIMTACGMERVFSALAAIIILRNIFMISRSLARFRKFSSFAESMAVNPAQTIVLSFILLIAAGTISLAMPFAHSGGMRFSVLDSLFTATSAVCVTGLIVTDTAISFSFWGKLVILTLIQTGGLGIMILSFSAVFMFRKTVSLENRKLISYMINEDDMSKLSSAVRSITALTLLIEAAGAAVLYFYILPGGSAREKVFYSVFHSVSAFCNAGFALFSDSLEGFVSSTPVVLTISALIILGGISFSVMTDTFSVCAGKLRTIFTRRHARNTVTLNTRIVLAWTFFLLLSGTLLVYILEHGNSMKSQGLYSQYLSAFFQSVTLRTAGFNTISFAALAPATLFLMILFMFTGGASGSTAGGIKVNTLAVIASYFRSFRRNEKNIVISDREVSKLTVLRAFSVLSLALVSVVSGYFLLLVSEKAEPLGLLFEAVSAFCTVGLSTGITSTLSPAGKVVIIILMFAGRLGPLTIVASMATDNRSRKLHRYPEADIPIG